MSNLMEYLYAYAQTHRLEARLLTSAFYQESRRCADKQKALLHPLLNSEALFHFENLCGEEELCRMEENAACFQLGFSAALELLLYH